MRRLRRGLAVATVAVVLSAFIRTGPVTAHALFPSAGSGGTWDFNQACDNQPFSRTYSLWYIVNASQAYPFDIPNPHFVPGERLTVTLAPTVVGKLAGTVSLTGTTTVTGQLPTTSGSQAALSPAMFTLSFKPGPETVGSLPVPAQWASQYKGFTALTAVITGDKGTQETIVALAQPFKACSVSPPPTSTETITEQPLGGGPTGPGLVIAAAALAALLALRRTGFGRRNNSA
jgi:hypothetical protein